MYKLLIVAVLLSVFTACDKNDIADNKSATELLTQQAWTIVSHGYDENNNGKIDEAEESIQDCEKDNTYKFNVNGTGNFYENALSCTGTVDYPFEWEFINNETQIDFTVGIVSISKLSEQELLIYEPAAQGPKLMTKFVHQ